MLMDNLIPKVACSTVGYADFRRTGARVIAPRGCTMRRRAIDRNCAAERIEASEMNTKLVIVESPAMASATIGNYVGSDFS